jgi:hypothetical protein
MTSHYEKFLENLSVLSFNERILYTIIKSYDLDLHTNLDTNIDSLAEKKSDLEHIHRFYGTLLSEFKGKSANLSEIKNKNKTYINTKDSNINVVDYAESSMFKKDEEIAKNIGEWGSSFSDTNSEISYSKSADE